jgi:hypothetical protein
MGFAEEVLNAYPQKVDELKPVIRKELNRSFTKGTKKSEQLD